MEKFIFMILWQIKHVFWFFIEKLKLEKENKTEKKSFIMLLNTSKASFFLAQGAKSLAVLYTKMGSAEIPCPNLLSLKMILL